MKREDVKKELAKLGITDEKLIDSALDTIMDLHGKDIEKSKNDLAAVQQSADTLKNQLDEASKTIEGFKKLDIDSIKKQADEYKTKYDEAVKKAADDLKKVKFDHALESELKSTYKAKDHKEIMPHLKIESILFDDAKGTLTGLKEQVEPLLESKKYLFVSDEESPEFTNTTQGGKLQNVDKAVAAMREGAGLKTTK